MQFSVLRIFGAASFECSEILTFMSDSAVFHIDFYDTHFFLSVYNCIFLAIRVMSS